MYDGNFSMQLLHVRLLLLLTLGLLTFGIVTKTWYNIRVNLDECTRCDSLVMAIGRTLENWVDTNFTVQNYVDVYGGIWSVSICTAERLCLDLSLEEASGQLGAIQMFSRALVSLRIGSWFLQVGYVIAALAFVSTYSQVAKPTLVIWSALISGVLTFCSAFVSTWAFLLSMRDTEISYTKSCFPLAILPTLSASYISFYCMYSLWEVLRWKRRTYVTECTFLDSGLWKYWKYKRKHFSYRNYDRNYSKNMSALRVNCQHPTIEQDHFIC